MVPASQDKKWLIFIDTNIFLDFYRSPGELADRQLTALSRHLNIIIASEQVQMEFLKNRQKVMKDSIDRLKLTQESIPSILSDTPDAKKFKSLIHDARKRYESIKSTMTLMLEQPDDHDTVYSKINNILEHQSSLNFRYSHDYSDSIVQKARNRFHLGFPPRKNADTSYGDSVNWEWIIRCAKDSADIQGVLIVARDNDYGLIDRRNGIINDWLRREFRTRAGSNKDIRLTNKLSDALKKLGVGVTPEDEGEEEALLWLREEEQTGIGSVFSAPQPTFSSLLFPVGTQLLVKVDDATMVERNKGHIVRVDRSNGHAYTLGGTGSALAGTWRVRGAIGDAALMERVA